MILNHRLSRSHARTIEEFARFSLPSKPRVSLASMLLDELSEHSGRETPGNFPLDVCEILLMQWLRCLGEKYVSMSRHRRVEWASS